MVELLILLAISWLVIWFFEKGNLSVLGLRLTAKRLKFAGFLFFLTALCCATGFWLRMYFLKEAFGINPAMTNSLFFHSLWQAVRSVLFEELLCRGILLYILIKKMGPAWAIFISSLVFGALHWNNIGFSGNLPQIILVFFWPFLFGLVFAYAYFVSGSIYLPIAMHLGWNLVQNFIFPGNTGPSVLIISSQPLVTVSYFIYFMIFLFPKIAAIIFNYLVLRQYNLKIIPA